MKWDSRLLYVVFTLDWNFALLPEVCSKEDVFPLSLLEAEPTPPRTVVPSPKPLPWFFLQEAASCQEGPSSPLTWKVLWSWLLTPRLSPGAQGLAIRSRRFRRGLHTWPRMCQAEHLLCTYLYPALPFPSGCCHSCRR